MLCAINTSTAKRIGVAYVQHENVLIVQANPAEPRNTAHRVYFAPGMKARLQNEDGWRFLEEGDAYLGLRAMAIEDGHAACEAAWDDGSFLRIADLRAPLVFVTGRRARHATLADFMQYVPWSGDGLRPVGYGYRSVEFIVQEALRVEAAGDDLAARQALLDDIDARGLVATPKNSSYNELVMEAGRLSILHDGREVLITYGEGAGVSFREY